MTPDHYQTLGIPRFSDAADVKSAYRQLAAQYHPDRNPDPNAAAKFIEITEAYEALSEPNAKATYDALLRTQALKKVAAARLVQEPPRAANAPPPSRPNQIQRDAQMNLKLQPDLVRLTRLLSQSKFNDAEQLAKRILGEDDRQPVPYAVLGDIHRFRGDLKKSAEMYSYAAQMAPENDLYVKKHEEALVALAKAVPVGPAPQFTGAAETQRQNKLGVGIAVAMCAVAYIFLAREQPLFPNFALVSSWTLGLVIMTTLSGIAVGASLALSDHIDSFASTHQGGANRVSPSMIITILALLSFWLSALVFAVVGLSQNAINRSTGKVMGATLILTMVFTMVWAIVSRDGYLQTLLWSGNLIYLGAICGWMVSDTFRN